jgi:hypothetical protein
VIVGASVDLSVEEIEKLRGYWVRGGNLLVLLNPKIHTPNLNKFIASLGIVAEDDRVLQTIRRGFSRAIEQNVVGEFLPKAEPSKRLIGSTIYFPDATQSLTLLPDLAKKNQIQLRPLIRAVKGYWGERDYKHLAKKGARYEEGRDVRAPVIIAASAERGGLNDERVEVQSAKLVVIGNSEFSMNRWLGGTNGVAANLDFFLGCLNWLVDRGRLAAAVPKTVTRASYLNLTPSELNGIALNTIIIIPGLAAIIGIFVWLKRRK